MRFQWRGQKLRGHEPDRLESPRFLGSRYVARALRSAERGPAVDDLRTAATRVRRPPPSRARSLRDVSGAGGRLARRRGPPQLRGAGVSRLLTLWRPRRRVRPVSVYGVRVRPARAVLLLSGVHNYVEFGAASLSLTDSGHGFPPDRPKTSASRDGSSGSGIAYRVACRGGRSSSVARLSGARVVVEPGFADTSPGGSSSGRSMGSSRVYVCLTQAGVAAIVGSPRGSVGPSGCS